MPRGNPVILQSVSFTNQGEATEHFKAMLARYAPGQWVGSEDAARLYELLLRHPEAETKIGCGITAFSVMMTEHGTPCFRIHRRDGSGTDFSYRQAIVGRPRSAKQEVLRAFRHAVQDDIFALRNTLFGPCDTGTGTVACALTGTTLTRETCHIDHAPPMTFERIVIEYIAAWGYTLESVPTTHGADDQVHTRLTDPGLAAHFREHHRQVARLIPIRKEINLAQASQHRLRHAIA